jgi:hypothetical protein
MEEHVPTRQSNDRNEPLGEEANMEMLGLEGSADDDIGTTNMEHKECGDRNDRKSSCWIGKTGIFSASCKVTIIKNCITCGTIVFAIYSAQVADHGDTSLAEYKEDESVTKTLPRTNAKVEWFYR